MDFDRTFFFFRIRLGQTGKRRATANETNVVWASLVPRPGVRFEWLSRSPYRVAYRVTSRDHSNVTAPTESTRGSERTHRNRYRFRYDTRSTRNIVRAIYTDGTRRNVIYRRRRRRRIEYSKRRFFSAIFARNRFLPDRSRGHADLFLFQQLFFLYPTPSDG